ncbi:Uncharacterized protein TPAR_07670 [Tolypocladium paradoxum]|uniref:Secreted protein n=1 Tax=Tolypocladium paradoxum TaxID=94208 RepID=A0A2S4KPK8_9HYPO|nr:Uncharacterized protein TPAR_07670 [Tolypocladium paradoxum]
MKFAASITALSCLSLGAFGFVTSVKSPLEGYTVREASWEVQATPGGPTVVLNGTVQDVHAQLVKLNPDWEAQFADDGSRENNAATLEKRTDFMGSGYVCGGRWKECDLDRLIEGIRYLRNVTATQPYADGGTGICSRVSCSYNAAIWWCNDDPSPKQLVSFGSIADGVQYLIFMCQALGKPTFSGQVFHSTHWNVVATAAEC